MYRPQRDRGGRTSRVHANNQPPAPQAPPPPKEKEGKTPLFRGRRQGFLRCSLPSCLSWPWWRRMQQLQRSGVAAVRSASVRALSSSAASTASNVKVFKMCVALRCVALRWAMRRRSSGSSGSSSASLAAAAEGRDACAHSTGSSLHSLRAPALHTLRLRSP